MIQAELLPALCITGVLVMLIARWLRGPPLEPGPPCPGFSLGPADRMPEELIFSHILVTGHSGSGKSSGPMDSIIRYLMRRGWGVMFMVVKADEADKMLALAREEGREKDFIRFSPSSGLAFDFLKYELSQPGGHPRRRRGSWPWRSRLTAARAARAAMSRSGKCWGRGSCWLQSR